MPFWKKTPKPEAEKPQAEAEAEVVPTNPYIAFELVDGVHLEISIGWPVEGDIKPFARVLSLINSGMIIGPQLAEAALYAGKVNQPDKAIAIHAALDAIATNKKRDKIPADKPLVPPSKVLANQMKFHNH